MSACTLAAGARAGNLHAAQGNGDTADGREAESAAQPRHPAVPGRTDAQGHQAAAAPQHRPDSQKQKPSEGRDGAGGAAVSGSTGVPHSNARQPQLEAGARQGSPARSVPQAVRSTDTASASGAAAPRAAAKPQRALQQPGKADAGLAATSLASTKPAAAQRTERRSPAEEPGSAGLKPPKEAGAPGVAVSAGAGKPASARPLTPEAALQSSHSSRGTQAAHESPASMKDGQIPPAPHGPGAAAATAKPATAVTASAPAKAVAAASQGTAATKAAQASSQPAPHGVPPTGAAQSAPQTARAAAPPGASSAQQAQRGSAAPKADQAPVHRSAQSKQGQDKLAATPSHGAPAAAEAAVSALARSAPKPGLPGQSNKSQAPSRPAEPSAHGKPVPSAASASRLAPGLAHREKPVDLKSGSIAGAPKSASAGAEAKAAAQPTARVPVPAPKQVGPVSTASAEQRSGNAHLKEDASAGKAARVSRFAPVGYTPATGGAPKVQISRLAAGASAAGATARLQQGSGPLGSAQRAGADARQDSHAKVRHARLQYLPGVTWRRGLRKTVSPACFVCFTRRCRCEGAVCPASKQGN